MKRWVVVSAAAGALVVLLALVTVLAHDYACHSESLHLICERADGSTWKDPSGGCQYEDPRCGGAVDCERSKMIDEGFRDSCGWVFFR